ncbi:hypothetical protein HDV00_000180 [Rhizophlyctis rosea]|nr:hypothetical protein HDV00_000180 [Rhizophlyctis rosea]
MSAYSSRRHSVYVTEDRIVLDIGSLYIKCGFSGEPKPRHVFPCTVPLPYAGGHEGCRADGKLVPLFHLQLDPEYFDYLKNLLSDKFRAIYHNYLLTDPKQRKVIICESPLLPLPIKKIIASVLFETLQVPSITFIPSHLLALLTVGKTTGLVVDCGYLETTVLPVYDGRPLIANVQSIPLAGEAMTSRLKTLLKNHGSLVQEGGTERDASLSDKFVESLPLEFLENTKAQACYVGAFPKYQDVSDEVREKVYPYRERQFPYTIYNSDAEPALCTVDASDQILVPGWVRERAAEVLFEGDDDGCSIATVVLDAILKVGRHRV